MIIDWAEILGCDESEVAEAYDNLVLNSRRTATKKGQEETAEEKKTNGRFAPQGLIPGDSAYRWL